MELLLPYTSSAWSHGTCWFQNHRFLNPIPAHVLTIKFIRNTIYYLNSIRVSCNSNRCVFFKSLRKNQILKTHYFFVLSFTGFIYQTKRLRCFHPLCRQRGQQSHTWNCSRDRKRIKWSGCSFLRSTARQQLTGTGIQTGRANTRLYSSARRYSFCGGVSNTRSHFFASMFQHTVLSSH